MHSPFKIQEHGPYIQGIVSNLTIDDFIFHDYPKILGNGMLLEVNDIVISLMVFCFNLISVLP